MELEVQGLGSFRNHEAAVMVQLMLNMAAAQFLFRDSFDCGLLGVLIRLMDKNPTLP